MAGLVAKKSAMLISRASRAWKFLHGTINIYKPADMKTTTVINAIKKNICKGERIALNILNIYFDCYLLNFDRFEFDGTG